jgi:hypothetical protein
MLKRDITYEDFNGDTITESFYFNLTRTEVIELEVGYEGGLEAALKRIVAAENREQLVREFKKIVLLSYGVKSEDGKRFIKNDKLREEFSQTAAFDMLFMDLATNDDSAATFVKGILPKDMAREVEKAEVVSITPGPDPKV